MGIMAIDTQQVVLPSVPLSRTLAVNSGLPISILVSVTLPAQPVRLGKGDRLTGGTPEDITVVCVMAVETPAVLLVVVELDVGVGLPQDTPFCIDRHVRVVTARAGEDIRRERWSRNREFLQALGRIRLIRRLRWLRSDAGQNPFLQGDRLGCNRAAAVVVGPLHMASRRATATRWGGLEINRQHPIAPPIRH